MINKIKKIYNEFRFDVKHYDAVKNYLEENYDFDSRTEEVGEIYKNKEEGLIFLQKRNSGNQGDFVGIIAVKRSPSDFEKIKTDLERIIKK